MAQFPEHVYRLLNLHLMPVERRFLLHDFCHTLLYSGHVQCGQRIPVSLVDAYEEALGYRPSHHHLAIRENVLRGLVEQEAE